MTGDLVGTLRYMSPEQALAQRVVVDHRTDVYSLGVTLYELLTLQPAFPGNDRQELLRQIAFEEPRAPRRIVKAIPAELETVVLKAMAKNPADRYGTAQELADDLRRFLDDKPIRARRPTLRQRLGRWSRRHQALVQSAVFVLGLAMVGLAIGSYLLWQKENETRAALKEAQEQRSVALANEAQATALQRQAEVDLDKALNSTSDFFGELDKKEFAEIPAIRRLRQQLGAVVLHHYQSYLDEQSPDPEVRHRTARTYLSISGLHASQGEHHKAQDALVKSVALSDALTREFPGVARYWHQLAHSRAHLAKHLLDRGLKPQAAEEYRKMRDAFEAAAQAAPDDPRVLNKLAWNLATEVLAIRDPKRAVELAKKAVQLAPNVGHNWNTLGAAYYRCGDYKASIEAQEKSMKLRDGGDCYEWFFLAMAHAQLGHKEEARQWYDKAVAWMDKNEPLTGGLRGFCDEATDVLRIVPKPATPDKKESPPKK
jgi:tetratricopeptide (TPR) repeat protein